MVSDWHKDISSYSGDTKHKSSEYIQLFGVMVYLYKI